jgi:hypothetical protein
MKKIIIVIILFFLNYFNCQSARVITNIDIANWYIDSDLVLIGNVDLIEKRLIIKKDSVLSENLMLRYDVVKEKYIFLSDTIIKGKAGIKETLLTQRFIENYSTSWIVEPKPKFVGFSSKGDSILETNSAPMIDNFYDDNYFRLNIGKKYIVLLKKVNSSFEILYANEYNNDLYNLIIEVKLKGQSYIDDCFKIK